MLLAVVAADIDSVAGLDGRSVQTLMRELDQKDLVVALTGAAEPAREKFLSNMSARVRGFIETEIEFQDAEADEVESTRRRLLLQCAQLAEEGQLDWIFADGPPPTTTAGPDFRISERLLEQVGHKLDQLTPDAAADLWTGIGEQARREGILSLELVAEQTVDPFVREAVMLAVDGTEPFLLRDILETRRGRAILPQQETRGWMIIEGVMAIMGGDNPGLVRHKLQSLYLAQPEPTEPDGSVSRQTSEQLAERLRQADLEQVSFEELSLLITDLAILARSETTSAFEPLPGVLDRRSGMASELMKRGMELLLEQADGAQVMEALKPIVEKRIEALGKAHDGVILGIVAVQAGKEPDAIGDIVRAAVS